MPAPQCVLLLAQCLERCPELLAEDLRLFPGGEVAAPAGLVEVDEVGVNLLGPAPRRLDDLAREDGEADRERQLGRLLAGRQRSADALGLLPVEPCRRR